MAERNGPDSPDADGPDPNEPLVKVFDAEHEAEALVVKGLLESAGIEADITSLDAVQDVFPGVGGTIILVRQDDAQRAREVIAESQLAPIDEDDDELTER